MRNLDECKAEVFRRSHERIKKRQRNKKRILTFCIPLFLCIAVYMVVTLPSLEAPEEEQKVGGVEGEDYGSCFYTSVEIKRLSENETYSRECVDQKEVEQMLHYMNTLCDTNEGTPLQAEATYMDSYAITFLCEECSSTTYILADNELVNIELYTKWILSEKQMEELKETFDIPNNK